MTENERRAPMARSTPSRPRADRTELPRPAQRTDLLPRLPRSRSKTTSTATGDGEDTETVWVSFGYSNHDPNTKVSYIARANGKDFRWGDLDCCGGHDGRFAFPIERRSGRDLGGAAYEVRIYMSDHEVAMGGFGIRGREGFDHHGQGHDNNNGNDNEHDNGADNQ